MPEVEPAMVGMPEIRPEEASRESPSGSAPATENTYGPWPPVAANCAA